LSDSTAHFHSSSGELIGTTLPTVDGTTVRIRPPHFEICVRVSFTYSIEPRRT
jgi:hypothetical protein